MIRGSMFADREIDLGFLEERYKSNSSLFCHSECYCRILRRLEEKADAVKIKGKRSYGLIARKIEGKDKLRDYLLYDLSEFSGKTIRGLD